MLKQNTAEIFTPLVAAAQGNRRADTVVVWAAAQLVTIFSEIALPFSTAKGNLERWNLHL